MPARMAIIAMTTSSSISVKAELLEQLEREDRRWQMNFPTSISDLLSSAETMERQPSFPQEMVKRMLVGVIAPRFHQPQWEKERVERRGPGSHAMIAMAAMKESEEDICTEQKKFKIQNRKFNILLPAL